MRAKVESEEAKHQPDNYAVDAARSALDLAGLYNNSQTLSGEKPSFEDFVAAREEQLKAKNLGVGDYSESEAREEAGLSELRRTFDALDIPRRVYVKKAEV